MRKTNSIVLTIIVGALMSCSLIEVSHTIDPETDFSRYKTFTWYSDGFADSINGLFGVDAAHLDSAIRDSIQQQLHNKGLNLGQPNSADLWINYQAIAQRTAADRYQYRLEDLDQSYIRKQIRYSSSFDASRRFTTFYDEGTFVVDVIDRTSLQVIWRGSVELPIGLYDTEAPRIARMQKAIKKLLAKYPTQ